MSASITREEFLRFWSMDEPELREYAASLADENDKLRELVRDMYDCFSQETCTDCPHKRDGKEWCAFGSVGWQTRRIKELGVEV